ncbi:MAG: bifunctional UDP-N-acetylglucosamine diphosphorylase/glucosamine-1-phosphate N-acetyltransferase GlmU [Hydrogenovibrio sp.]|nr:bifunctional UDP-N-acetylglucosamine diphosphorylase/glucosamine-1-phosphate N-acetyltransferase GlmU [Hydrogenovibrio sp.]
MSLKVVILAAGKGTRMKSSLPKVLQPLAMKPLLAHVIETAEQLPTDQIVTVIGHGAERVQTQIQHERVQYVMQEQQLGTGHAVMQANAYYQDDDVVLILYGDVPLTRLATLQDLLGLVSEQSPLSLLTMTLEDSTGYGRIVRDHHHQVTEIVEEKDASPEQKQIREVNTGIMAVKGKYLMQWLDRLSCDNAQSEYYLTDIIAMCVEEGRSVATTEPDNLIEVLGVNNKVQLQNLERAYQAQMAEDLMVNGATLMDASRIDIRGSVDIGQDVLIDVNVVFEGKVTLGDRVVIGPNCVLKNCHIANDTKIEAFSHIEDAQVGQACVIGPYARLRPGTELAQSVKIGNFVETKKAKIDAGSKVNHLSYIGDTQMGKGCNIGAGTITCNYDGVNKHQTIIGDHVFVGSDTQLVAPVIVESGATIGAGSTITKLAPADELTLSRSKQLTVKGWQKPKKQ